MFYTLMFNSIYYVFLLLCLCIPIVKLTYFYCYVCSVLCILFHCVVLCIVCVWMCTVLLPPGVNPTAVNKCIIINSRQQITTPDTRTCCYTPAIAVCGLKIDVLHSDMAYHRQLILSNIPRCMDLLCLIHQRLFLYTYIYRLQINKSRLEPAVTYESLFLH